MSTDRELLELAAKAVGLRICHLDSDTRAYVSNDLTGEHFFWAPRDDDGDAFRLGVMLDMDFMASGLMFDGSPCASVVFPLSGDYDALSEPVVNGDRQAAARLVVLRAAAEIGKSAGSGALGDGGGRD